MVAGGSDSCVCSRSHGQPPGARSWATMSQSFLKEEDPVTIDFSASNSQVSTSSNAPERAVCSELRYFAGRFFADVNGDGDDAGKGADQNKRDQPRRDMADSQRAIEIRHAFHCARRVQKNFSDPRHQNENENKYVIAFQPATDRFQLADLETGQDEILANQFFPFALQQISILHHHGHEKMRF